MIAPSTSLVWANAEVAASGEGDLSLAVSAEQSAEQVVRSSHAPYKIRGGDACLDVSGVDIKRAFIDPSHLGAHLLEDPADKGYVADIRDILDLAGFIA